MPVISSTTNAHVNIKILNNFLIQLIENWFGDEVIFQDDNTSWNREKGIKAFLQKNHKKSITWLTNSLDLNPVEKFKVES